MEKTVESTKNRKAFYFLQLIFPIQHYLQYLEHNLKIKNNF